MPHVFRKVTVCCRVTCLFLPLPPLSFPEARRCFVTEVAGFFPSHPLLCRTEDKFSPSSLSEAALYLRERWPPPFCGLGLVEEALVWGKPPFSRHHFWISGQVFFAWSHLLCRVPPQSVCQHFSWRHRSFLCPFSWHTSHTASPQIFR